MPGICDFELFKLEAKEPEYVKPFKEARYSLTKHFKEAEHILATSEAERKVPESVPDPPSSLLNSQHSPYGCDETITSLGIKYWGYQQGTTPSLEDMVVPLLPLPLQNRFRATLPWDRPPVVLEKLADLGGCIQTLAAGSHKRVDGLIPM